MKSLEFSFVCDILVSPSPHDHPHMCTLIMIEKRFCLAAGLLGGHSEGWRQGHKSALLCKRTTSPSFDQQCDNIRLYDRDGFCIVYNVLCNVCIVLPACALPHIVLLAHFALCAMCCAKYSGISNRSNFSGDLKTVLTMLTFSSSSWAVRRISLSSVLRHVEDKET